jgi:hypothetical protein
MYQLAQANIARMIAPLGDPIMAGFVAMLVRKHGDTPCAFSLKKAFPAPHAIHEQLPPVFEECLA